MVFNSIRWRLQIWYGLILTLVLAGFGFTAFQMERGKQMRRIDEELTRRANVLASALRRPEMRGGADGVDDGRPPRREGSPDGRFGERPPPGGPQRGDGEGARGPQQQPRFRFTPQQSSLFEGGESNAFYYALWWRTGDLLVKSPSSPGEIPKPNPSSKGDALILRNRGDYREAFLFTPPGECVLAGRLVSPDLEELHKTAWMLTGIGTAVLLAGIAVGGWIAARAIRPIEDISATAVKIAAGDLSQRIDIGDTETELGRLAGVLNSTFSRLDAAFAQQGRFTSDAAHELRTPVSVILTQTQTALSRERTASEFRKTVEACQRAAQRMRRLIESLLELARLDAGQDQMQRVRFDLGETIRDCVELIRPLADERNVMIHCNFSTSQCEGDPERLAQVITNLLTNAIQYNEKDGHVEVSVSDEKGLAVITVKDTGQGIPRDDLPHIFDRFYRVDKSRSGSGGRTGLGLAITKAIVTAHSGTIKAESELGVGTAFIVRLPRERA